MCTYCAQVIEDLFRAIDVDNSKFIDISELKKALFEVSSGFDAEIVDSRMKELDFNNDKEIDFPEFIFGIVAWVGYDDDDDESEQHHQLHTIETTDWNQSMIKNRKSVRLSQKKNKE